MLQRELNINVENLHKGLSRIVSLLHLLQACIKC